MYCRRTYKPSPVPHCSHHACMRACMHMHACSIMHKIDAKAILAPTQSIHNSANGQWITLVYTVVGVSRTLGFPPSNTEQQERPEASENKTDTLE